MQVHDATESVKQIGLAATGFLLLLIGAAVAVKYLFKYFSARLDKKDDQLTRVLDERRDDLVTMVTMQGKAVEAQEKSVEAQEKITDALTALADEIRRKRK